MTIQIAEPPIFVLIDRQALAERIEHVEFSICPTLMEHGVNNAEVRDPCSMVVSTLYGIAARLKLQLETGASAERMQDDFLRLALFEDAAEHWVSRTTKYDEAGRPANVIAG